MGLWNRAIRDWPALYAQAYTNLKPGGYFEASDSEFASPKVLLHGENGIWHGYWDGWGSNVRGVMI